ncbi:MAG: MgtC/SapB family protein [Acidobacteriota bacterium]
MIDAEMAGRLLLSALFGTLVGIERQWRHKSAGLKTNALVSVGATSFGLIALISFGPGSSPTQIAAGVVTGIGFIGAGVIMHRGASVQGINTAANLWAAAGMGLAIGQGSYQLAAYVLGTVLMVQFSLQWATNYINRRSGLKTPVVTYRLSLGFNPASAEAVRKAWASLVGEPGVTVTSYGEGRNDQEETVEASIGLAEDRANAAASLSQRFAEIPGVIHTHCEQMSVPKGE